MLPLVNQAATSPDPDPEPVQLRSSPAPSVHKLDRLPGELLSSWCLLDVELEQTVGLVASYTTERAVTDIHQVNIASYTKSHQFRL